MSKQWTPADLKAYFYNLRLGYNYHEWLHRVTCNLGLISNETGISRVDVLVIIEEVGRQILEDCQNLKFPEHETRDSIEVQLSPIPPQHSMRTLY